MLLILVLGKRIFSDSSVLNLNNIGGGGGETFMSACCLSEQQGPSLKFWSF